MEDNGIDALAGALGENYRLLREMSLRFGVDYQAEPRIGSKGPQINSGADVDALLSMAATKRTTGAAELWPTCRV